MPEDNKGQQQNQDGGQQQQQQQKQDDKFTIKVNGKDQELTKEEVVALAQKAGAADQRFQEAAKTKKDAERGLKVMELWQTIQSADSVDEKDVTELAGLLGIDAGAFLESLGGGDDGQPPQKGTKTPPKAKGTPSTKVKMEDLPDDLQEDIKEARKLRYERIQKEIKNSVEEGLDKDKEFGKMISGWTGGSSTESTALKSELVEALFEDVQRRILAGEPYGPDLITSTVQRMRQRYGRIGKPAKSSEPPVIPGLGPSGGLPMEVLTQEPVKRISSTDRKYMPNFVQRVTQQLGKALGRS